MLSTAWTSNRVKKQIKIAIVDDSQEVRESLVNLFVSGNTTATAFASAEEFLEHNDIETFSCLITDVKMGRMSGYELQQRLLETGYKLPIIFMSAYFDTKMAAQALSRGALVFLLKPVDGEEILDWVGRATRPS